jgi:3D (Asp-Asp-Asp) domain-containing protein
MPHRSLGPRASAPAILGLALIALAACGGSSTSTHPPAQTAVSTTTAPRPKPAAARKPAPGPKRPSGASGCHRHAPPPPEHLITHRQWLSGVTITEYYPAPESWFVGRAVRAPGVGGRYPADWLYSARGLAMEGDGVDPQGHHVHIAQLGSTGWVNATGRPTLPVCLGKWTNGFPAWLRGGWRNARGGVTFPLASGGWSNGPATKVLPYGGVSFAPGSSMPLRYYHSIAVDPRLIPLGSRVYVPFYHRLGGGWFVAQDTGGAIKGRHIDVYRPPPPSPNDLGRYLTHRRVLVIPPA